MQIHINVHDGEKGHLKSNSNFVLILTELQILIFHDELKGNLKVFKLEFMILNMHKSSLGNWLIST